MSWRFVFCAVGVAVSSTVSQQLYADQQACEALVAVSYVDTALEAADQVDKQLQQNLNRDFLKALAEKTPLSIHLDPAQGRKALAEVRSGRADLIIGISSASEKDARLDYLTPAYMHKSYRLWMRVGEQVSLKQWPELAGLRGVRVLQAKHLIDFDRQAQELNWPMRSVDSLEVAVNKVLAGQADYLLAEQQQLQRYLAQKDLTQLFEFIDPIAGAQEFFLALSKDSACNSTVLRSTLNKALTQLTVR